jgi:hypothetical protein
MQVSEEYTPYTVREYEFWTLFLHPKQLPYLGRCYAWWKDREAHEGERMPFVRVPVPALEELQRISLHVTQACEALGYQTVPYGENFLLNIAYLANEAGHNHHMHVHFVPRTKIEFGVLGINRRINDREWGKNYAKPAVGEHSLGPKNFEFVKAIFVETTKKHVW